MIAARENPTVKTYTVAGKTLADIWKDIQKKGPVDPNDGKRYAGSCVGTFSIGLTDKDLAFEVTPGSSPVEVKAQLAEGKGKVTSKPAITMPKSTPRMAGPSLQTWSKPTSRRTTIRLVTVRPRAPSSTRASFRAHGRLVVVKTLNARRWDWCLLQRPAIYPFVG
jgi:hypothetical protein